MPLRTEGQQPERKHRRWVWLLAVGLVAAVVACAAFLPMVWPYAFLGEWENDAGQVIIYRSSGTISITTGLTLPEGSVHPLPTFQGYWRLMPQRRVAILASTSQNSPVTDVLDYWSFRPFGLRADTYQSPHGPSVLRLRRVLHPLTDWFPFLNQ